MLFCYYLCQRLRGGRSNEDKHKMTANSSGMLTFVAVALFVFVKKKLMVYI
jgi:hypothetical protein